MTCEILMHPFGNFTKTSYCETHVGRRDGADNATVGSLTHPGLCHSPNN